jgi:uncharacterized protein YeaO (DUF488 family)/Uri superfamily endonuclease
VNNNMTTNMYAAARTWNPFKGCKFDCSYCRPSFQQQAKRQMRICSKCYAYTPHIHPERLAKIPSAEIVFVAGNGDLAFCPPEFVHRILDRIEDHNRRCPHKTYYLQSKQPECLAPFITRLPPNIVLVTTLETNQDDQYERVSLAPPPSVRFQQFKELDWPRKVVTVEPVMDFDTDVFANWIVKLIPEYVWLGLNSRPGRVQLPEPPPEKLKSLVQRLDAAGVQMRFKDERAAEICRRGRRQVIKTKRLNDPVEASDGIRLLISRRRPRRVRNGEETWEQWWPALAPSRELHTNWCGKRGNKMTWGEYRRRFLQEMRGEEATAALQRLRELYAAGKTVTLLCYCEDDKHCHRRLVKDLVEGQVAPRRKGDQPAAHQVTEFSTAEVLKDRNILPRAKGAYILEFHIDREITINALSLGPVTLEAGRYRYFGNAQNGLWARVWRHLHPAGRKSIYMVDTLSAVVPVARIIAIPGGQECDLVAKALLSGEWNIPVPGFGSTDCKLGCGAHLLRSTSAANRGVR